PAGAGAFRSHWTSSDRRVGLQKAEWPQQKPGWRNEKKCPAPAKVGTDKPPDHIAERAPDRNRREKNRHDATPRLNWKQIRQDCRCSRAVASFANSNENASRKENAECRRQTGAAAGQTPQNHS